MRKAATVIGSAVGVMFSRDALHTGFGMAALTAIGVGLWWERPSLSLIVIGSLLLLGIINARRAG